jgi:hypothetical protein
VPSTASRRGRVADLSLAFLRTCMAIYK